MKTISLFTVTCGRELYLSRLLDSVLSCGGELPLEHVIVFQGAFPSSRCSELLATQQHIRVVQLDRNYGLETAMNKVMPTVKGDIVIKLDDDCMLRSLSFFKHVRAIVETNPKLMFSPYPVGLIGNPGGILSNSRSVQYSEDTDTYYTFRAVPHVGGFARITSGDFARSIVLQEHGPNHGNEDGQYSVAARNRGMHIAYLENALIVEHQESTLGQKQRAENRPQSQRL